jgi:hypothetical protein
MNYMVSILTETIAKLVGDNEPHFVLKTRRYSANKMAAVPLPNMEITKGIDKGQPAKLWIEKTEQKIVMLVVLDGKEQ